MTYSLHLLEDKNKVSFIKSLLPLLAGGGKIFNGDIAFETRKELENCKQEYGKYWDSDEIYFVYYDIKSHFSNADFAKPSHCSDIITLS